MKREILPDLLFFSSKAAFVRLVPLQSRARLKRTAGTKFLNFMPKSDSHYLVFSPIDTVEGPDSKFDQFDLPANCTSRLSTVGHITRACRKKVLKLSVLKISRREAGAVSGNVRFVSSHFGGLSAFSFCT